MVRVDLLLPMVNYEYSNFMEIMRFYFKEKWLRTIYENLKSRYSEMIQINLSLAEIGIKKDTMNLALYEARLLGCVFL